MGSDQQNHSHLIDFPEALEVLFTRLGELKIVLGPAAAGEVDAVAETLRTALAARQRGDMGEALTKIGQAMDRLAAVASGGDPGEGAAMRAVVARFREALVRGAVGEAQDTADVMRTRSGSVLHPKRDR
jgi:hypothetical protein